MLILKHLKTLQHVSIIIQIIIRELVGSLLKSLNLKFNCQRITTFNRWQLHFKFSDFNKEPTSSLMMIWMMIETCWSVLSVLILTF